MKNYIVIIVAALAIFTALLAVALRPVRRSAEWQTSQNETTTSQTAASYQQVSKPLTEKASETEPTAETTTVKVNLSKGSSDLTETQPTESVRFSSKLVSKLHEIAERDREWLEEHEHTTQPSMSPAEFRKAGVIYANGYRYTYYSEKVLPGPDLKIPGRHSDGDFVRDGDDYICVASCDLPKGTVVDTPFGEGKVYDVCGQSGTIDIYVSF